MNFNDFNLHPCIMSGINALGFTEPTPIQEKAIPVVLQGSDIVGLAQTGTGKNGRLCFAYTAKIDTGKERPCQGADNVAYPRTGRTNL